MKKAAITVGLFTSLGQGYGSFSSGSYQSSNVRGGSKSYGGQSYGGQSFGGLNSYGGSSGKSIGSQSAFATNNNGKSAFSGTGFSLSNAGQDIMGGLIDRPNQANDIVTDNTVSKYGSSINSGYNNQPKQTAPAPQTYNTHNNNNNNVGYGQPGMDGRPGKDGKPGGPGAVGAPGPYGKPGPKGDKGERGKPGRDGAPGKPGEKGAPGKPGKSFSGIKGDKGDKGATGQPGKDGSNGKNGHPGTPGKPGPQGEPGLNGKPGAQGNPGSKGEPGYTGRDGAKGPPGPPGKPKYLGKPGKPGPPGPPGQCDCKKRRRPQRNVSPVTIDTGIYDGDIVGGGYYDIYGGQNRNELGQGYGLSGYANNGYGGGYGATLPPKVQDNYNPHQNANYKVSLPDGASVANKANIGYGIGGAGIGGGKFRGGSSVRHANTAALSKKAGVGGIGGVVGHGKGKAENKEFVKGQSNAEKADVYVNADTQTRGNGYDDNLAYVGAEVFEDAAAQKKQYVKGEAFLSEGDQATKKESKYGGDAVYQTDDVLTNAKVAFEVDHSLNFRNDYADENHRGSYKGDEFDVQYKASDVQGGYANSELDREKKAAAYKGQKAVGDFGKTGKYYGDDYHKYGDEDSNLFYRDRGVGHAPDGYDPKYGDPNAPIYGEEEPDLYAKFKGDKKAGAGKPVYGKGYRDDGYGGGGAHGGAAYYPYGERYRVHENADKDNLYRGYGANFEGKDTFAKNNEAEVYAGAQEKVNEKLAFDKGNYREVDAKGKNKFATYAGDYQTNKKAQDVDFNVKHYEDLQQDLQQDIKSDQYYAKYDGEDVKRAREADKKFGQYTDAEILRKQDALINAKGYGGKEYANLDNNRADANIYAKVNRDQVKAKDLYAKPAGYRGEKDDDHDKKGFNGQLHDDKRASNLPYRGPARDINRKKDIHTDDIKDRVRNGNYGYYGPRRLGTDIIIIDNIRSQIASLNISKIASKKDVGYGVIALLASGVIGSMSFLGLMSLFGYKKKKIVVKEEDSELLYQ